MTPPFVHGDFQSRSVGVDRTNGRFDDVSVEVCRGCRRCWLRYLVEDEGFSQSGRWFRALVSAEAARLVTAESALALIEGAEVRFAGGSYFGSTGFRHTGALRVDV